jgi:hypothetical protein
VKPVQPATVHLIAQDIRGMRGLLTAQSDWALRQPPSETRVELLRRVMFWRLILKEAEDRVSRGEIGECDPNEFSEALERAV